MPQVLPAGGRRALTQLLVALLLTDLQEQEEEQASPADALDPQGKSAPVELPWYPHS